MMKRIVGLIVLGVCMAGAFAKLPPLSDEAKAKADEAKAKSAHADKVAAYKLCQSMDRVAAGYIANAKKAGKDVKPVATPPCTDAGPFVYPPPAQDQTAAAAKTPANPAKKP